MSVSQTDPRHCYDYEDVWFYNCSGSIGCSTYKTESPKPPEFSITHSPIFILDKRSNETCGNTNALYLGCCHALIDVCYETCPLGNLSSGPFSYSFASLQTPTRTPDPDIRPSSTSSSRTFVTSVTSTSVYSSASTETLGDQTALPTVSSVQEATSTPVSESTSTSPNTAAIAGGVVGGIAGLALLVGLLVLYRRRRKTKTEDGIDNESFSAWNSGQPHSMQPGSAELNEIKQGPSTSQLLLLLHTIIHTANSVLLASSPLPPPSAPPSPLLSPLPPPPAYASYNAHSNGPEGSSDHLHPSSGSPYVSHDVPSPESPPSPPPLKTRLSQQSADRYSDGQDVSPISPHYQHQPFDNPTSMRSSVYSEVSGGVVHAHAM